MSFGEGINCFCRALKLSTLASPGARPSDYIGSPESSSPNSIMYCVRFVSDSTVSIYVGMVVVVCTYIMYAYTQYIRLETETKCGHNLNCKCVPRVKFTISILLTAALHLQNYHFWG